MTFIFVRFCHFFSLHKVHCKCMQTSFCGAVLSHKIMFFNLLRYSKTSIETNIILTFSSLQKIHLEKSNFFLSHVCGGLRGRQKSCRWSAVVLTKKKRPLHLRLFYYRAVRAASIRQTFFAPSKKNIL